MEQLAWRSLSTIDQLKFELAQTQQKIKFQTVTAQDIGVLRAELQQTQQKVQAQCDEIAGMEKFSDEMMEHIIGLTVAFHEINTTNKTNESKVDSGEKERNEKLSMDFVAGLNVKKLAGHVHSGP